jgi:hypothetical protein
MARMSKRGLVVFIDPGFNCCKIEGKSVPDGIKKGLNMGLTNISLDKARGEESGFYLLWFLIEISGGEGSELRAESCET